MIVFKDKLHQQTDKYRLLDLEESIFLITFGEKLAHGVCVTQRPGELCSVCICLTRLMRTSAVYGLGGASQMTNLRISLYMSVSYVTVL